MRETIFEKFIKEFKAANNLLHKILIAGKFIGIFLVLYGFGIALVLGILNIIANKSVSVDIFTSIIMLSSILCGAVLHLFCSLGIKLTIRRRGEGR